jgi:type IV secretion system protein VirB2
MTNHINHTPHGISDGAWSTTICFMLMVVVILLPDMAAAGAETAATAEANQLSRMVCRVINLLQGNIARGVAAFGIIFLGFSLFLGKISWGTAIALALGLGAIFGAQSLVNLMSTGTGTSGVDLNCAAQAN